tara:strand:- start:7701 stop:7856 length:156 start_codon:yes stop_codon:yes gene_type:complete
MLTDFARFLEDASTLLIETAKIILYVAEVELEVMMEDVHKFRDNLLISWNK